eukprot:1178491-Prorocentrum_minimum.AAC.4
MDGIPRRLRVKTLQACTAEKLFERRSLTLRKRFESRFSLRGIFRGIFYVALQFGSKLRIGCGRLAAADDDAHHGHAWGGTSANTSVPSHNLLVTGSPIQEPG